MSRASWAKPGLARREPGLTAAMPRRRWLTGETWFPPCYCKWKDRLADLGVERADFVAVPVQDLKRADDFYGQTLGLNRNPNSSDRWVEYELGNVTLALVSPEAMGPEFKAEGHQMPIGLRVPDVEAARAKLEAEGVEFLHETIDSGVCHLASFSDPDGNRLQLHRRYAPYADGSTP